MERQSRGDCIRSENRQPMTYKISNDVAGCDVHQCSRASQCLRHLGSRHRKENTEESSRVRYMWIAPDPETCDLFVDERESAKD
jgi:hypothetical protein